MSKEEPAVLDQYGDLTLKVGKQDQDGDTATFIVCSRALARVSHVFDRMLYGHFAEATAGPNLGATGWTVNVPEISPAAMEVVLNIAHCHFQKVPRTLAVEDLYELTTLTHFYDATPLLAPWVHHWVPLVNGIATGAHMPMPKMLWISWELGCKEALTTTARRLVMESDGPLLGDTSEEEEIHTPPDLAERIDAIRTQTLCALIEIMRDMLSQLTVVDESPRWCRHAESMALHKCESITLESITFCLTRAGLWPLPDPEILKCSIMGLYQKLTASINDVGSQSDQRPLGDHHDCNPKTYLLNQIQAVINEIPQPLTDFHFQTVDEQAETLMITIAR